MLEIKDLLFRYRRSEFQLRIDHLSVERGEKVAIVGPSGSGKTTMLNLIAGIEVPEKGHITVNDQVISKKGEKARRDFRIQNVGQVFQQFELIEYLPVRENIQLSYLINPSITLTGEVKSRVEELAAGVGIGDKLNRKARQLSQGEQQRVAICRAMLPKPPLVLADEPTGNLDPANKARILQVLFDQCAEHDQTLLAVTHDMNIVEGFDRIIDFAEFHQVVEPEADEVTT